MAVSYQVPGVYVQEISSARSIQGVSTDVALFIGIPANYTVKSYPAGYPEPNPPAPQSATLITSWSQYQSIYSGFVWNCYLAYAVYNFFSTGGTACYVINAISSTTSSITSFLQAGTAPYVPPTPPAPTLAATSHAPSKKTKKKTRATHKALGDDAPTTPTTSSIAINVASAWLMCDSTKKTSDIYVVTDYTYPPDDRTNPPANPLFTIYVLVPVITTDISKLSQSNQLLQFYAQKNSLGTYTVPGTKPTTYYVLEQFAGLSSTDLKINSVTGVSNIQQTINGFSSFISISMTDDQQVLPNLTQVAQALGNDIDLNLQATVSTTEGLVNLLQSLQTVSIVAAPDNVDEDLTDQSANINVLLSALEETGSAIAVVDSPYFTPGPTIDNTTNILDFVHGGDGSALNSSYGAIYYPWIWSPNPNNGLQVMIPPSGMVTGRYAYTSTAVGVFGAPAGIQEGQLRLATSVSEEVTFGDQQQLNPSGINVIKPLLNYGICIWGARTFLQSNVFYVNVRRLLIYIEQSIYQSLQWVVFEPNNSLLWGTVTRDISAFLTTIWQQGGLVGASAEQAFYVICDSSNNTPTTMQQGILYVDVGVAPVTPAEFVVVRIAQMIQPS